MLVPHLTVAENIFLGREPKSFGRLIDFEAMFAKASALTAELKIGR